MWVSPLGLAPILRRGVPLTPVLSFAAAAENVEVVLHVWLSSLFSMEVSFTAHRNYWREARMLGLEK